MKLPSHTNIARAARMIDPVFRDTPLIFSRRLDRQLNCRLSAKNETSVPIGSFKGRGADFWMQTAHAGDRPVICASAGNFGQGIAYAARARGVQAIVFAAETANARKVEAMRALGAEVRIAGADFDAAKDAARNHAEEIGCDFLEDGAHPAIAEGAGTIAAELTGEDGPFDTVVVPLGNGALIGGIGTWLRHTAPETDVLGVVASQAPSMAQSWTTGDIVETPRADTIADGVAVRRPVPYALKAMAPVVDDILDVSEEAIREATKLIHKTTGVVVEPAGAVGVAAVMDNTDRFAGRRVATIFSGGNISSSLAEELGLPIGPG